MANDKTCDPNTVTFNGDRRLEGGNTQQLVRTAVSRADAL